jgi:ferredoxin-NADP reductase
MKYLEEGALDQVELPRSLQAFRNATPHRETDARIHPAETDLYACGITAMVQVLVRAARAVGVPEPQMQYDGFG